MRCSARLYPAVGINELDMIANALYCHVRDNTQSRSIDYHGLTHGSTTRESPIVAKSSRVRGNSCTFVSRATAVEVSAEMMSDSRPATGRGSVQ